MINQLLRILAQKIIWWYAIACCLLPKCNSKCLELYFYNSRLKKTCFFYPCLMWTVSYWIRRIFVFYSFWLDNVNVNVVCILQQAFQWLSWAPIICQFDMLTNRIMQWVGMGNTCFLGARKVFFLINYHWLGINFCPSSCSHSRRWSNYSYTCTSAVFVCHWTLRKKHLGPTIGTKLHQDIIMHRSFMEHIIWLRFL